MTTTEALNLDWHDLGAIDGERPGEFYGTRVESRAINGSHYITLSDELGLSISPVPLPNDHASISELRAYAAELYELADVLAEASLAAIRAEAVAATAERAA